MRGPDPDPGGRARTPGRSRSKRAELEALPAENPPQRRRGRRDPRDRRQRRLHGAEGGEPRPRGRGAARPLAARRGLGRGRPALGTSIPSAISASSATRPLGRHDWLGARLRIRRALSAPGRWRSTLVGACLIGFGVPLFWIWRRLVALRQAGRRHRARRRLHRHRDPGQLLGPAADRLLGAGQDAQGRSAAGRAATRRPSGTAACATRATASATPSDPIERLFVVTAIVSIIGFAVWFALFAGAPFPTNSRR